MTRLVLTDPPAVEPLRAAEIRSRLAIGTELSDESLDALVKAARQQIDGWTGWLGRALITQTWTLYLPCFAKRIKIPLPPLQSIVSVKYVDQEGVDQTVDAASYRVVPGSPTFLEAAYRLNWPAHRGQDDAVRISFKAGYGDAGTDVPEPIRAAITLMVSHLRSMSARNLFISQDTVEGIGSKSYVVGGNAGQAIDAAVTSLLSTYRVFA